MSQSDRFVAYCLANTVELIDAFGMSPRLCVSLSGSADDSSHIGDKEIVAPVPPMITPDLARHTSCTDLPPLRIAVPPDVRLSERT